MIVRRRKCCIKKRRVCYYGEESVLLRKGECDTEQRRV